MSAGHEIAELDAPGLRHFGLTTGAIIAVLFGAALPWLFDLDYRWWPWAVGVGLMAWGLIAPRTLRPVYRAWMRFGLVLNRITTPLVLGIVFFLIFSPIALIMRACGRDHLSVRQDTDTESYRVACDKERSNDVEKPY